MSTMKLLILLSFCMLFQGCVKIRFSVNGQTKWQYEGRNVYQEAYDRANWNYIVNRSYFGRETAEEILTQQKELQ